ncbi:MAG TPA: M15 family metallopeptidase [Candidatus Merdivicinus excrementipullorum]|uniref:M15 family metallopeptidase n=1 Tax=Candidatus Merdivicinus excrementipullorum TaxID=2840867 RepID=A0A9D1FMC8_9FIRM|nr:M15 family metallopeptidase [Candidatus Merdivicinus excrementipullorum]
MTRRRRLNRNGKIAVSILAVLVILLIVLIVRGCSGDGEKNGKNESSVSQESSILEESSVPPSSSGTDTSQPESSDGTSSQPDASDTESSQAVDSSSEDSTASLSQKDWRLTLVNSSHPLEDGYVPELADVDANGHQLDARAADALKEMLSDAKAAGLSPIVCSSYRTWEKQTSLFDAQVARCEAQGLTGDAAVAEARTVVAYPGTSEHQLGLAADIVALSYQILDEKQMETPEQQWLMEHCDEYGFILRYPEGKSDLTGVIFEPWHYRYVGKEAAKEIMSQGVCLEEYLGETD